METKHTPGPWRIDHDDDGFCVFADHIIAECDRGTREQNRANTHLIAAAPELFAEMMRFLPVLERAEADAELWYRLTAGLGIATLNAYRAAIAKAEGKL